MSLNLSIKFFKLVRKKRNKMLSSLPFYRFSLTRFINSIKHDCLCKILFLSDFILQLCTNTTHYSAVSMAGLVIISLRSLRISCAFLYSWRSNLVMMFIYCFIIYTRRQFVAYIKAVVLYCFYYYTHLTVFKMNRPAHTYGNLQ